MTYIISALNLSHFLWKGRVGNYLPTHPNPRVKKEIWVKPKTIMTYIISAINISHSLEGNGCIEESIPFDIEKGPGASRRHK